MSVSTNRVRRAVLAALFTVAIFAAASAPANAAAAKKGDTADAVQTFERDVFVIVGSTLRNPTDTTAPDAPLFSNSGVALGFTWGQWEAATATSVMRAAGKHTDADIALSGLVPNAVYSVFYGTLGPDSQNPLCPGVERTLPLTSRDRHQTPDFASFVAGPDGTATYSGRVAGDLLDATQVFIAIVYHLDGQTYGSLPNHGEYNTQGDTNCRSSFGEDAMRQLLVLQKW